MGTYYGNKAYLYEGETYELLQEFSGTGNFGSSVAGVGSNILVGTYNGNKAYLYDGETYELLQEFSGTGNFGYSVAGVGSNVLVGAYNAHKAYLYDGETFQNHHISQVANLTLEAAHDLDGMVVRPAGRVDGGRADFLVTAEGASAIQQGSYLVFSEALSAGLLDLSSTAVHMQIPAVKGIGDLNRDGFDDLGAAVSEAGATLDHSGVMNHQVVQVLFGGPNAAEHFAQPLVYPDLVFEPDQALFTKVQVQTMDAGDSGTTQNGTWTGQFGGYAQGGDFLVGEATQPGLSFEWVFQGLNPSSTYSLQISLPVNADLGFDVTRLARYEVKGALETMVPFDQHTAADSALPGSVPIYLLGSFQPDAEGTLKVTLVPEVNLSPYPTALKDNSEFFDETLLLGPPDGQSVNLGSALVTYDFADVVVVDREGADFRVFAQDLGSGGVDPFSLVDVWVSADGRKFVNVTELSLIHISEPTRL